MAKKFRLTRELFDTNDAYEKALALLSGIPVVTVAMDLPETTKSVLNDGLVLAERVSDKVLDFFDL